MALRQGFYREHHTLEMHTDNLLRDMARWNTTPAYQEVLAIKQALNRLKSGLDVHGKPLP